MGNVLLISPQVDGRFERFGPPLGLLYLAPPLINSGYNVEIVDFTVEKYNEEKLSKLIKDKDIIGISIMSKNLKSTNMLIHDIKGLNKRIPIIIGGPDCTLNPRLIDDTDISVIGEAEHSIIDIVDATLGKKSITECDGVIFRREKSHDITIKEAKIQYNLDNIEFPARYLVESYVENGYNNIEGEKIKPRSTSIITSRGCPMKCRFCVRKALSYSTHRKRSVENVIEEIHQIYVNGYKVLDFVDDNLTFDSTRAYKIMEGIVDMKINIIITLNGWVGSANEKLFEKMKEAGVRIISFGIESGKQDVLDYYNKGITLEEIKHAVELANACDMYVAGHFIIGSPIETQRHFQNTLLFAKTLPLDFVNFRILEYAKGSSLWDEMHRKAVIDENEVSVLAGTKTGLSKFTFKELDKICEDASKSFYNDTHYKERFAKKRNTIGAPYLN